VRRSEVADATGKNITQTSTARDSLLASLDWPDGIRGYHNRGEPAFYITISSPAIGLAAGEETSRVVMSGLSGAGESQSHDSHGILEAGEVDEVRFSSDSAEGVSITRHRKKPRSSEGKRVHRASKKANRRANQLMEKSEKCSEASRDSAGPTGLVVPEMFENEEAAAALEVPLGDDGPPGVVETSTAIGGNSNWSSQDSGSLATTFSMSLASVSAVVAGPEPSDEAMVDLGGEAHVGSSTTAPTPTAHVEVAAAGTTHSRSEEARRSRNADLKAKRRAKEALQSEN